MKIQESAQHYLETIFILQKRLGAVRSIDIATELDYSKPSVSRAVKNLRENDYITVDEKGYICLSAKGKQVAETMYERHATLAAFLISLGVCETVAYEDACRIEHVISEESFRCLKTHLEKL